jgi:hypothetical protein
MKVAILDDPAGCLAGVRSGSELLDVERNPSVPIRWPIGHTYVTVAA